MPKSTDTSARFTAINLPAVALDSDSLKPDDIDLSGLEYLLPQCRWYAATKAEQTGERIARAHIVLSNKVAIDRAAINAAPHLQLIVILATGSNNVDLDAAAERGIRVCNIRDYATTSLAEHCFTVMMALMRHLPDYNTASRDGRWRDHTQFCLLKPAIQEVSGKTLALIGLGASGLALAQRAEAFGMRIIALTSHRPNQTSAIHEHAPHYPRVPLEQLLSEADVLSIHCPLNEATKGIIDRKAIATMKASAIIINAARGGIVDETALTEALDEGRLAGAGVDVMTEEPPRNGNPLLDCQHPNLIITPHNAWGSQSARQALIAQTAEVLGAWQAGTPLNVLS